MADIESMNFWTLRNNRKHSFSGRLCAGLDNVLETTQYELDPGYEATAKAWFEKHRQACASTMAKMDSIHANNACPAEFIRPRHRDQLIQGCTLK